jgi:tRNA pseudouridine38-40 synthase
MNLYRYKIIIEYDGSGFAGWQRQLNAPSVQAAIEDAIYSLSQERVTLHVAGRTDAGVHATGQVAHFDLAKYFKPEVVTGALNFYLKHKGVVILGTVEVDFNFHARFSATKRSYQYFIINRKAPLVIDHNRAWHVKEKLNVEAMHEAAQVLVGTHDFTSFRALACQSNSPIKTIDKIEVYAIQERIHFILSARSFLHHMVRNIVGTLRLVGNGKWSKEDVAIALAARNRSKAGPTAPPDGLYLIEVLYDL